MASREDGGLERHFLELCGALARAGCYVTAVADPRYAPALDAGVRFIPFSMAHGRYYPAQLHRLHRVLRACRCDLIHAQAHKAAAMLAPLRRWLPVPALATVHGIKRGTRVLRHFDAVVAVSRAVAASLQGLDDVRVIENGIAPPCARDPDAVARLRAELLRGVDAPLALACGRLVGVKGFDTLIDAWRDVRAQLVIAGDGPLRAVLAAHIQASGLGARIRLLGERDDVPALMAAADLFVLSSRREGIPYVLLEALHARKPVVATRVGGAQDLLPSSCLAPVDDPAALARAVNRALPPEAACRHAMAAAWDYARRELTLEAMVSRHLALYESLCCV